MLCRWVVSVTGYRIGSLACNMYEKDYDRIFCHVRICKVLKIYFYSTKRQIYASDPPSLSLQYRVRVCITSSGAIYHVSAWHTFSLFLPNKNKICAVHSTVFTQRKEGVDTHFTLCIFGKMEHVHFVCIYSGCTNMCSNRKWFCSLTLIRCPDIQNPSLQHSGQMVQKEIGEPKKAVTLLLRKGENLKPKKYLWLYTVKLQNTVLRALQCG